MILYLSLAVLVLLSSAQTCSPTTITVLTYDGESYNCVLEYLRDERTNKCSFSSCHSSCSDSGHLYTNESYCRTQCPYDCSDHAQDPSNSTETTKNQTAYGDGLIIPFFEIDIKKADPTLAIVLGATFGSIIVILGIIGLFCCCRRCANSKKQSNTEGGSQNIELLRPQIQCLLCNEYICNIEIFCQHYFRSYHSQCLLSLNAEAEITRCDVCGFDNSMRIKIYCMKCHRLRPSEDRIGPDLHYQCFKCRGIDEPAQSITQKLVNPAPSLENVQV